MSADPAPPQPRGRPHWIVWMFALFGLAGVGAVIFIAAVVLSFDGPREPARVAGERPEESFTVRDAEPLRGTNLIRIEIAAETGRRGSGYSSGGMTDLRNILLLDRVSGATRRLLPNNGRRIERSYFLPAQADFAPENHADLANAGQENEEEPPPAYYVLLVEQPERDDRFDMLVGTLASGEQNYVMAGLDGVDSVWMHGPATIGFVVRERLNLYYRIVDIASLRVVQSRRIAI